MSRTLFVLSLVALLSATPLEGADVLGGAQLPAAGAAAQSRLQGAANVRLPSAAAAAAAKAKATTNANLSAAQNRLKANTRANANAGVNVGVGGAAGVRTSAGASAALNARSGAGGRNPRAADNSHDRSSSGESSGLGVSVGSGGRLHATTRGQNRGDVLLRTDLHFRSSLAKIEQMRDLAVERADVDLLRRADALEAELRARYRGAASATTDPRPLPPTANGEARNRVNGRADVATSDSVQDRPPYPSPRSFGAASQIEAGGGLNTAAAARAATTGRAAFQSGAEEAQARLGQQTMFGARARGRAGAAAATRAGGQLSDQAERYPARFYGRAREQFQAGAAAAGQLQGRAAGQFQGGLNASSQAAERARQQGQNAVNNARLYGEANADAAARARLRGPQPRAGIQQRTQGGGAVGATQGGVSTQGNASGQSGAQVQPMP